VDRVIVKFCYYAGLLLCQIKTCAKCLTLTIQLLLIFIADLRCYWYRCTRILCADFTLDVFNMSRSLVNKWNAFKYEVKLKPVCQIVSWNSGNLQIYHKSPFLIIRILKYLLCVYVISLYLKNFMMHCSVVSPRFIGHCMGRWDYFQKDEVEAYFELFCVFSISKIMLDVSLNVIIAAGICYWQFVANRLIVCHIVYQHFCCSLYVKMFVTNDHL